MVSPKAKVAITLPAGLPAGSPMAIEALSEQISNHIDVYGSREVNRAIAKMAETPDFPTWKHALIEASTRCTRTHGGVQYVAELYLMPVIFSPDQEIPHSLSQGFMEGYAAVFSLQTPAGFGRTILVNQMCTEDMIRRASCEEVHEMLRGALVTRRSRPLQLPETYLTSPDVDSMDNPLRFLPMVVLRLASAPRFNHAHANTQAWLDRLSEFFSAGDANSAADIDVPLHRRARVLPPMRIKNNEVFNAAAFELSRGRIAMMAGDYVQHEHAENTPFKARLHFDEQKQLMHLELSTSCCEQSSVVPLQYQYDAYPFIDAIRRDLSAMGYTVECRCTGNHFIPMPYPYEGSSMGLH